MKNFKAIALTLTLVLAVYLTLSVSSADNIGGTAKDPLVTKSYVDEKIKEIENKLTGTSNIDTSKAKSESENKKEEDASKDLSKEEKDLVKRVEELEKALKEKSETKPDSEKTPEEHMVEAEAKSEAKENLEGFMHSDIFLVIEAARGNKLILGAGAECVLRAGEALVIASENGGLADLTAGADLANDNTVPPQHLLLASRNDGRGLFITSERTSYILVKGDYKLQ